MKTRNRIGIAIVVLSSTAGGVSSAFAQGSLTPPGAPAPAMKTMAQVEPRTPISSAPYYITQPGSYYLTTNITATGHGIIIQADRVTVDLMGFSLLGSRGASSCGISLTASSNAALHDVVVRGGTVSCFGYGLLCGNAQNCRFEGLTISSNVNVGVTLSGDSGLSGGNTIADCTISDSNATGIILRGQYGQCNANTVAHCVIKGCAAEGILLYGADGQCNANTIYRNVIVDNGGMGIWLNGDSAAGDCHGNTVTECLISGNAGRGINLYYANGNRIEGNHISAQVGASTYGIKSGNSTQNIIVRNTCIGNTNNLSPSAADTYGPIVTNSGALSGTDPWANFSR